LIRKEAGERRSERENEKNVGFLQEGGLKRSLGRAQKAIKRARGRRGGKIFQKKEKVRVLNQDSKTE